MKIKYIKNTLYLFLLSLFCSLFSFVDSMYPSTIKLQNLIGLILFIIGLIFYSYNNKDYQLKSFTLYHLRFSLCLCFMVLLIYYTESVTLTIILMFNVMPFYPIFNLLNNFNITFPMTLLISLILSQSIIFISLLIFKKKKLLG